MNLLDKNWPGLLILVALAIFSCEDAHDIGLGLDPDGIRVKVLYTELPLEATNVRLDSIKTSGDSRLLVGKNIDPTFGTTRAVAFSQLSFPTTLPTPTDDHTFVVDSTVIHLHFDDVHTDQIAASQHFDVYQLTDTLFGTATYLANFDTPYRTDKKEGSFDFILNETRILDKDSLDYILKFRMEDTMGDELFAMATGDQGSSVSPAGALRYEYKGIAIVGAESNNALISFKPLDSTSIVIHYHEVDPYTENSVATDSVYTDSLTLNVSLGSFFYNQIKTDRSGSTMAASPTESYTSFTAGDGNIYLQPASGIFPKLNLDTLNKFFEANPTLQVNRLEFVAETKANSKYYGNAPNLRYLFVDGTDGSKINSVQLAANILTEAIIMTDNGYLAGTAEALVAPIDETALTYSGVPTFFGQLVESKSIEVDHLLVMPQDISTPKFSIFDEKTGFRIKLYYTLPE